MQPTLTLSLTTGQVLHVQMSEPQERLTYEALAKHQQQLDTEARELAKTYHLGVSPTPGRGYDDRLTVRLGMSRGTLLEKISYWEAHGGKWGGLRSTRGGNKHWVSELACRQFLGDITSQAA